MLEVKVSIDLGRGDIGVAQQLLDTAQVVAGLENMGCERMPEQVWKYVGVDALVFGPVSNAGLYRPPADALAAVADEHRGLIGWCDHDLGSCEPGTPGANGVLGAGRRLQHLRRRGL